MVILYVCTGNKYSQWWINNLKYMLDQQKVDYESFVGITEGEGSVYDKLKLFQEFKDQKQYLYFDLDVIIRRNISPLVRKEFTLVESWWRQPAHTPLNSSIMSWFGDYSYIHDKFFENEKLNREKYNRGIDEFIYKEIEYKTYIQRVCWSWEFDNDEQDRLVCLFNQSQRFMKECEWAQEYLLLE